MLFSTGLIGSGERSEPALGRSRRRRENNPRYAPLEHPVRWRIAVAERVVTVTEVLDGHTSLDIQCLDRIYLNVYVPKLQTSPQVVAFLSGHLGYPFPSPALFRELGDRFRRTVAAFAADNDIRGCGSAKTMSAASWSRCARTWTAKPVPAARGSPWRSSSSGCGAPTRD